MKVCLTLKKQNGKLEFNLLQKYGY